VDTHAFDAEGKLVDDKVRGLLTDYVVGFAAEVNASARGRAKA